RRQEVRDVHAEHHEVALGEVDDPHDAEDQREANAHERVHPAHEQPGHHVLDEVTQSHVGLAPCSISPRRALSHHAVLYPTTPCSISPRRAYFPVCQTSFRVASSFGATVKGSPPCHWTMIGIAPMRRPCSS